MKSKAVRSSSKTGGLPNLTAAAAAAINRVEGLYMPAEMTEMFRAFERDGLPHDMRRANLRAAYGKQNP